MGIGDRLKKLFIEDLPSGQPKEDGARLKYINDELDEHVNGALEQTKDWSVIWRDALKYVFNNQLEGQDIEDGWPRIQVNYIYPAIQQGLAMIAQRRPQIEAVPVESRDTESAKFWTALLRYQFEQDLDMAMCSVQAFYDGTIYGYYVGKVYWESQKLWVPDRQIGPDKRPMPPRWQGGPKVNLVHPIYFGADPEAENITDAAFVLSRRRVPTRWAMQRWPQFKNQIEQAASLEDDQWDDMAKDIGFLSWENQPGTESYPSNTEARLNTLLSWDYGRRCTYRKAEEGTQRANYITLEEHYWRDPDSRKNADQFPIAKEHLMESGRLVYKNDIPYDTQTGLVMTEKTWPKEDGESWDEPVYPRGRFALRIGGPGKWTILNPKEAHQVWPHTRWPFVVGVNGILPHVWRGLNSVEMATGLQDFQNISASHAMHHIQYFCDPSWKCEEGALPKGTELDASPGKIVKTISGAIDRVRRESAPQMDPSILAVMQHFSKELRDQLGMQEIGMGREGSPKTAAEAMSLLQMSRQRTILQTVFLDAWLIKIMEAVAELDSAKMAEGDMVRVVGEDKRATVAQVTADALSAKFDIRLDVGTALPFDREKKKLEYAELFKTLAALPGAAVAFLPQLLEVYEIPEAEQILAQVQQTIAVQQQQQLMAQAQKA